MKEVYFRDGQRGHVDYMYKGEVILRIYNSDYAQNTGEFIKLENKIYKIRSVITDPIDGIETYYLTSTDKENHNE